MRPIVVFAFTLGTLASLSGGAAADLDEGQERLDRRLSAVIEAQTSAVISRSLERQVELLSRERTSPPASPAADPADVADRSKRRSGVLRLSRVATATQMRCAPSTRYSLECVVVLESALRAPRRGSPARPTGPAPR
jgi:hypothetical protein